MSESPFDPVKVPGHYTSGKIEVTNFITDQRLDFPRGNVVKYVARAGKKDPTKTLEDLEKAAAYLQMAHNLASGKPAVVRDPETREIVWSLFQNEEEVKSRRLLVGVVDGMAAYHGQQASETQADVDTRVVAKNPQIEVPELWLYDGVNWRLTIATFQRWGYHAILLTGHDQPSAYSIQFTPTATGQSGIINPGEVVRFEANVFPQIFKA